MKRTLSTCLVIAMLVVSVFAQKSKPWAEWSKKDAEKMLNDSAWGRTQEDTDTSEMTYSPTVTPVSSAGNSGGGLNSRGESGAKNQALSLKYRIRFFSAKPVREGFARLLLLSNQNLKQENLQPWIDGTDFGEIIVVAVTIEATDRRQSGPAEQAFNSATAAKLKNSCYLERKDGKRIFLEEYQAPTKDQTGAKFVFPRMVDGKPFLTEESDNVRFVAEFNDKIKLNMKYKVADMMYNGKLEY